MLYFPLDERYIEGYTTKKQCLKCQIQLKDCFSYWKCCTCGQKTIYCNDCYIKIRKKKIDSSTIQLEFYHPYIRVRRGWKIKTKLCYDYSIL